MPSYACLLSPLGFCYESWTWNCGTSNMMFYRNDLFLSQSAYQEDSRVCFWEIINDHIIYFLQQFICSLFRRHCHHVYNLSFLPGSIQSNQGCLWSYMIKPGFTKARLRAITRYSRFPSWRRLGKAGNALNGRREHWQVKSLLPILYTSIFFAWCRWQCWVAVNSISRCFAEALV